VVRSLRDFVIHGRSKERSDAAQARGSMPWSRPKNAVGNSSRQAPCLILQIFHRRSAH